MSELKAFDLKVGKNLETDSPIVVGVDNKWNSRIMSCEEVYLKSEADKVIEELKADAADALALLEERNRQIGNLDAIAKRNQRAAQTLRKKMNHQKYKRCLAMAKWCNERIARIEKDYSFWQHGKDYASNFYTRWEKRWFKIAEKFKEAKDGKD